MNDRFDEVLTALEREGCDMAGRLDRAQARVRELERVNLALRAQLAELRRGFEAQPLSGETPPDDGDIGLAHLPEGAPPQEPLAQVTAQGSPAEAVADTQPGSSECQENSASLHSGDEPFRASDEAVNSAPEAPSATAASAGTPSGALSPQALLAQWYERYPRTFFKHHTRPLAIGIHESLAAREAAQEKLVRRALAGYVNLPRYLKSVRSGAARIDLEGREVGRVGEEDALHAREQLKALQAKQKAREAQKQQRRMAKKMSQLANRNQRSNDAID